MAEEARPTDPLKQLETRILADVTKRHRRLVDDLKDDLRTHHTEQMRAINLIQTTVDQHNAWILAKDAAQAVIDRANAEQAQKELWLAEEQAKEDKLKAARRARWTPYLPIGLTALGSYGAASLLYLLENLNNLHWDLQTKGLVGGLLIALLIGLGILRYVSGGG